MVSLARGSFAAWLGALLLTLFVLAAAEASPLVRRLPPVVLVPILVAVLVAFPLGCAAAGAFATWRIATSNGRLKGYVPATLAVVLGALQTLYGLMLFYVAYGLGR